MQKFNNQMKVKKNMIMNTNMFMNTHTIMMRMDTMILMNTFISMKNQQKNFKTMKIKILNLINQQKIKNQKNKFYKPNLIYWK